MSKRKIIVVDEEKCNGCGACIPNCPEGALQVIDGKVRLVSDLYCDGLGACIGYCPEGAITVEQREAQAYDERKVMANIIRQGRSVIAAHLSHLKSHKQVEFFNQAIDYLKEQNIENPLGNDCLGGPASHGGIDHGCPGSEIKYFREKKNG